MSCLTVLGACEASPAAPVGDAASAPTTGEARGALADSPLPAVKPARPAVKPTAKPAPVRGGGAPSQPAAPAKPAPTEPPAAAEAPVPAAPPLPPPDRLRVRPLGHPRDTAPRRIVFVSIDTLAANHLSTYGYERRTSPALSAFAREAVVFENAIASAPWTYPSYASQMTSRHSTAVMELGMRVPESQVLLAEYMRSAGYATAGFVDNEYLHPMHGFQQGYDHYRPLANSRGRSLQEALGWAHRNGHRPYFLFVHTNDVHGPYLPRAPFTDMFDRDRFRKPRRSVPVLETMQAHVFDALPRYQVFGAETDPEYYRARYDASIRQTDLWFEKLLNHLRALPDWDRTVVVFSADHGESFGNHHFYLNHGLVYEDIIRVPLLIRLPGGEAGGTRIRQQVSMLDLLPTLTELAGEPLQNPIAGKSLLPLIRGEVSAQHEYVFASQGIFEQFMVRTDRYKLIQLQPGTATQDYAWRTYPRRPRPGRKEVLYRLYDLGADPNEEQDLARRMPQKVAELRDVLERWREDAPGFDNESFELSDDHKDRLRQLGYVQ